MVVSGRPSLWGLAGLVAAENASRVVFLLEEAATARLPLVGFRPKAESDHFISSYVGTD